MQNIEVKVLNPDGVADAEKMVAFAARLTQRGHKLQNMEQVEQLYEKACTPDLLHILTTLPHPTIQKFGIINIVVVGASRRFLAQITRHQNEVKFMSGSLQYSDYTDHGQFVVPYELQEADAKNGTHLVDDYLDECKAAMATYATLAQTAGNDAAGYVAPQGLRNVLVISATPFQWKHMIGQRICRRNSPETRYVMLKCWEALYALSPALFDELPGPSCYATGVCNEGKMSCRHFLLDTKTFELFSKHGNKATAMLKANFPLLYEEV